MPLAHLPPKCTAGGYYPPANAPWRNGIKTVVARICGASTDLYNSPKTVNFTNCRVWVENANKEVFAVSEDFLNDANNLILSPNPTNGELRFRLGLSAKTDVSVALTDLAGRTLQTQIQKLRGVIRRAIGFGNATRRFVYF